MLPLRSNHVKKRPFSKNYGIFLKKVSFFIAKKLAFFKYPVIVRGTHKRKGEFAYGYNLSLLRY